MSRVPPEKYVVLQTARFHELCGFLNLKGQCCSDPDKKIIERAFRKKALKTHPDKGGDPVEFKKINDAYNRLMGHITKLELQNEETDIACNSIIIEISKIAVPKWRDKLKKCYGIPKCDNVKNLVFEGPYEQYRGRSNHTGPITVVLYIDPQDYIPKLHIQAEKYMAWITEQRMPMHLHVDKAKQIQFDQWRICHPAEFGLSSFGSNAHMAPPPTPTPKPKRKAREKNTEPKPKSRRDSTPKQAEEAAKQKQEANSEPKKSDSSGSNVVPDSGNPDEINGDWEEVIESPNDPKLNNMASEIIVKDGKRYRKKSANPPKPQEAKSFENKPFTCGQCGTGYLDCGDYTKHRQMCVPDEDFNEELRDYFKQQESLKEDNSRMDTNDDSLKSNSGKILNEVPLKSLSPIREEVRPPVTTPSVSPAFMCNNCNSSYSSEVTLKRHNYVCKSTKSTNSKLKQKGSGETNTKLSDASCNGSAKGTQNTYEHEKVENNNVKKDKTAMDCNDMYAMLDKINEGIRDENKSDQANTNPSSKEQSSHRSQISETHKPSDTHINIPNKIQSTDKTNEPNDISAQKQENITVSKQSTNLNGCEPPSANPVYSHSKQIKMTASDSLTPKTAQSDIVVTNVELKQSNLQKDQTPSTKLGQKLTNGNLAQKIKSEVNGNSANSKKNKMSSDPSVDAKLNKVNKPWRQSNPEISKFNVEKSKITEKIPEKNKSLSDRNKTTATKEKKLDELEIISQTCNKVTAPVESNDDKVKIVLKDKEEKMQIDVSQANDKKTKLGKGDHQNKEGKLLAEKMEVDEPQTTPSKDDKMVKSGVQATPTTLSSKTSEIQMASHTTGGQENKDSSDLQLNTASSISQTSKDKVNITCNTITTTTTTANTNFSIKEKLSNTTITSIGSKIGLPDSPPISVPGENKSTVTNNISTPINTGLSQSTKETKPTTTINSNNTDNEKNGFNISGNKEKLSTLTIASKINKSHQVNGLQSNITKNSSTSIPQNSSAPAKQSQSNQSLQMNGMSQTNKSKTTTTASKITSARGTQLKTSSSANQIVKDNTGAQLKTPSPANENIKDRPSVRPVSHNGTSHEEPVKRRRRNESAPAENIRPKSEKVIYINPNTFCKNTAPKIPETPFSPKVRRSQSSKILRLLQKFKEVEV